MEHNSIKDIAQMIKEMGGKKVQNNAAVAVDGSNALDVAMTTITYPENRVVNQTEQENKVPESPVDERKTGGAIDNAIGCVGLFNNITVAAKNVSGVHETWPFDFYRIDANTDM